MPTRTDDPPRRDPLLGQVLDGRYVIEEILGEGAMGIVYGALHDSIDKRVAIKVLRREISRNEQIVARFKQEAQMASRIGNEHIVDISDFGRLHDGSTYFAMERLCGRPLSQALREESFDLHRTVHIGRQLCSALGAAHAAGIVHRDLKPDNIQLVARGDDDDFVKVLDFGIAKVLGASRVLTQAGQVFGTPHYMSPEQCAAAEVDHRTDIYAVGVILYEMATGRVPFDAPHVMGILQKQLYEAPCPPSAYADVPRALESAILRCLAKRPDERFVSMRQLELALAAVQPDALGEPSDVHDAWAEPTAERPRRVARAAPLAMLALLGAALFAMWRSDALHLRWPGYDDALATRVVTPATPVAPPTPTDRVESMASPAESENSHTLAQPLTSSPPERTQPEPAENPAPPPPPPLQITSRPPGAVLYLAGNPVGTTPLQLDRPLQSGELLLRLTGYKEALLAPPAPDQLEVSVELQRIKPASKHAKRRPQRDQQAVPPPADPQPTLDASRPPEAESEVLDPWG